MYFVLFASRCVVNLSEISYWSPVTVRYLQKVSVWNCVEGYAVWLYCSNNHYPGNFIRFYNKISSWQESFLGLEVLRQVLVIRANFHSLYIDNVGALSQNLLYDYKTATCVVLSPVFKFFLGGEERVIEIYVVLYCLNVMNFRGKYPFEI